MRQAGSGAVTKLPERGLKNLVTLPDFPFARLGWSETHFGRQPKDVGNYTIRKSSSLTMPTISDWAKSPGSSGMPLLSFSAMTYPGLFQFLFWI
jgi:hypothetical protein